MVDLVVLHAGPHKTGTTALQQTLAANAGLLARHGVLYPATGRSGDSHAGLAEALIRGDASGLPALAAEATGWRGVLIATEHLSALSVDALIALRRLFPGAEFRVSYTLRRLATLWPSHWAELVKHGQVLSFAGYLTRVSDGDDRPWHAPVVPLRQLDRLASVFGAGALRIGIHEARLAERRDIGPAFIDELLGLGQIAPRFATSRRNPSPPDIETALVYLATVHAGARLDHSGMQRLRPGLLAALRRDPPPEWRADLERALDAAGRLTLTEGHPLVREAQSAVIARFGPVIADAVDSYLAPVSQPVPQLERLRLSHAAESALTAEIDGLIAAVEGAMATSGQSVRSLPGPSAGEELPEAIASDEKSAGREVDGILGSDRHRP